MSFVNGLSMPWHNLVDKIDGKTFSKEYEAVEGMLDRCYISPYFITNQKNQKCVLTIEYVSRIKINCIQGLDQLSVYRQRCGCCTFTWGEL
ncbi:chaperonin CPN60-1, mitochondrial-like isoform X1 [Olea europaea var. sylvestris]|uniref:chaperonin CPN60-1, mitochondrial-like isoform X1 n=1 Tax=Olea europaea var. sylvestris TaxID=158386 RepID=UPI000C1D39A2|nr:chaperonin CPN60-1, mitochondrial-like isoform X1 [Olea europaea var. sylvestris]